MERSATASVIGGGSQQRRGRRRPPLLIPIIALLILLAGIILAGANFSGCLGGGEGEESTSVSSKPTSADEAVRLEAEIGEPPEVGDIVFQVLSLRSTAFPSVPSQALERQSWGPL